MGMPSPEYIAKIEDIKVEESLFLTKKEIGSNDLKTCLSRVLNNCRLISKRSKFSKEFTCRRTQLMTTTYGVLVKRLK